MTPCAVGPNGFASAPQPLASDPSPAHAVSGLPATACARGRRRLWESVPHSSPYSKNTRFQGVPAQPEAYVSGIFRVLSDFPDFQGCASSRMALGRRCEGPELPIQLLGQHGARFGLGAQAPPHRRGCDVSRLANLRASCAPLGRESKGGKRCETRPANAAAGSALCNARRDESDRVAAGVGRSIRRLISTEAGWLLGPKLGGCRPKWWGEWAPKLDGVGPKLDGSRSHVGTWMSARFGWNSASFGRHWPGVGPFLPMFDRC